MAEVVLTGVDAVKHIAEKYSWNIYVPDYGRLNVIAYRTEILSDGTLQNVYSQDSENIFTMQLTVDDGWVRAVAGHFLEDCDWDKKGWVEYDSWIEPKEILYAYKRLDAFTEWFDENIVDYLQGVQV